jgi:hypothetical protein
MIGAYRGVEYLLYFFARVQKKIQLSASWNSIIHPTSVVSAACQLIDSNFSRHSYCGYSCTILNAEIGSFCSISDNVIIGGTGHPLRFVSTSPVFLSHKDSVKSKYANMVLLSEWERLSLEMLSLIQLSQEIPPNSFHGDFHPRFQMHFSPQNGGI